ncbi:DEAD/DEAH box helicase [Methanobrevibacter oralis]|uniref:DEAD-box ATP-dependent RNA helicase CshA n=1 Tax=Methanobrevibacter oralis TaxID=66851 RepID=A0A166B8M6_METOA|nr:DEAD/DEAH box helicase [Methanobrevibacter oralis]KZX13014.1 DEAD-box ATP-dependent RNA helicase CshA [Methanobrevibacter oralis]
MSYESFNDFKISKNIKKAIKNMGFEKPTTIQKLAIPEALKGKDIIGQAQTGSGKTVAFSIPILERIFIPDKSPQAIILCPTRELCMQVAGEIAKVGANINKLKILAVYGGQPIGRQLRVLNKGVHIVVGTPGRVIDHIERGSLNLIGVDSVVLDEADEMLNMGFREDIELILRHTPKQRQTLLFSATMPDEIKRIAKMHQHNPKFIKVSQNKKNIPKIKQFSFKTDERDKLEDMLRLLDVYEPKRSLIFCNTKKRVDFVVKHMRRRDYSVDSLHGDMTQKIRDKVMNKFRNGNIDILVATDVAARGIDVLNIDLVINYDVPQNVEYYIHRIGRTARAGNNGYAFTLVSPKEAHYFSNIKKRTNYKITKKNIPSFKEIENIKNNFLMDDVKNSIYNDNLKKYIKVVESSGMDSVEIAAALFKMIREK